MQLLSRVVGPLATNVHVLADERSREAIAIDTATPAAAWLAPLLVERGWLLRLIVSTHGHWDHIGDNAAVQAWSRTQAAHLAGHGGISPDAGVEAQIAVHPLDAPRLRHPDPLFAPFEIPPSYPAVELGEGGRIRFGEIDLQVLHTPGHTEGSVSLLAAAEGVLFSGDTLFASRVGPDGSAGRVGGADRRIADPSRRARGPRARAAGPRRGDGDRPRAAVARPRPHPAAAAVLGRDGAERDLRYRRRSYVPVRVARASSTPPAASRSSAAVGCPAMSSGAESA